MHAWVLSETTKRQSSTKRLFKTACIATGHILSSASLMLVLSQLGEKCQAQAFYILAKFFRIPSGHQRKHRRTLFSGRTIILWYIALISETSLRSRPCNNSPFSDLQAINSMMQYVPKSLTPQKRSFQMLLKLCRLYLTGQTLNSDTFYERPYFWEVRQLLNILISFLLRGGPTLKSHSCLSNILLTESKIWMPSYIICFYSLAVSG